MPYKSNAQRKKFHAMEKRGEISHKTVHEFDKASKGMHLPGRKPAASSDHVAIPPRGRPLKLPEE